MARNRKEADKDRWYLPKTHQYHLLGYCFQRSNRVNYYIRRLGDNKGPMRLSSTLSWSPAFKSIAFDNLCQLIDSTANKLPSKSRKSIMTFYELLKEFSDINFSAYHKYNVYSFRRAIKYFITEDYSLLDIHAIRDKILYKKEELLKLYHPNTIRGYLKKLRQIFQHAVNEGYMPNNPITSKMIPKEIIDKKDPFDPDEVSRCVDYARLEGKIHLANLIELISLTAVRIGEALLLSYEDILPDKLFIKGKGGRGREFPLKPFPDLRILINNLLKGHTSGRIFPWQYSQMPERQLKRILKILSIEKGVSFHAIRRMRENQLIRMGLDLNTTAELLGHTRQVQERHYIEVLGAERASEIIKKALARNGE